MRFCASVQNKLKVVSADAFCGHVWCRLAGCTDDGTDCTDKSFLLLLQTLQSLSAVVLLS